MHLGVKKVGHDMQMAPVILTTVIQVLTSNWLMSC